MLNFLANFIIWDANPMLFEFTIPNVNLRIFYFILAFVLFCVPYWMDAMFTDEEESPSAAPRKKISPLLWKIMGFGLGIAIVSMILIGKMGQSGWSLVSTFLTYFIVVYIGMSFFYDDNDGHKSHGKFDARKWGSFVGYPAIAALVFGVLLKVAFGLTTAQMWEMVVVSLVAALLCTPLTLETPSQPDATEHSHRAPSRSSAADIRAAIEKRVKFKYIVSATASAIILSFTFKSMGYIPFDGHADFPISVRWYGLMFAVGFLLGTNIVNRMFRHEGAPEKWVGWLLLFVIIATIVGARAGHVFFYEWDYYSQHPEKIVAFWEGGLASHGGTMAIIIAVYIYSYVITRRSPMWTFDRLVIPIALVGAMIRIGNLMNSEIFGHATSLPWGFMFLRSAEWQQVYAGVACHPTQIYESLAYLALFGVLMWMYWKKNAEARPGLIFGVFLVWLFTARLFIEILKNPQVAFEENMVLNMGQLLSLPFILAGLYMIVQALRRPKLQMTFPNRFPK